MYIGLHVKLPCQILIKIKFFFDRFSKNIQISNFIKIRQVGGGGGVVL